LRDFVQAADVRVDWQGIEDAPNEALVNALCMMSPFGVREKQALLEAETLKTRAEVLIALTEIELARGGSNTDNTLQ
jgi:Lon protease-like protein